MALSLFALAIGLLQLYKSELIRGVRARNLRRKIVPLTQSIMALLMSRARAENDGQALLEGSYDLMRARADLEQLYKRSKPLFDQERLGITLFLEALTKLSRPIDGQVMPAYELEETVLRGQRVVQELKELGL